MTGFTIDFTHPWLLFVLIPAFVASFVPYFTLKKKYRRTRNRITSLVLHTTSLVLAIMMLAGMHVDYTLPNTTNEIIILVDLSDTSEYSAETRDGFVQDIIMASADDGYNVGVVTFGFNQVYAAPMTKNVDSLYDAYLEAEKPDTTASDLAAAIKYAASLFNNPESGKIVLITDGRETDENALNSVRYVVSQNTRLDVAYVPAEYSGTDIQLLEVEFPNYTVSVDAECEISISFYSDYAIDATLTLSDNGVIDDENGSIYVQAVEGNNKCTFKHKFTSQGLHKLDFTIEARADGIEQNNMYSTYYNLTVHDKILLVSRDKDSLDESEYLLNILDKAKNENDEKYDWDLVDNKFVVTSMTPDDENFPTTVDELREYDQVILNNIANSDLQQAEGFVDALYSYVYDLGGGLFTIGGSDGFELNSENQQVPTAHAYDRTDMYKTKYQEMLPVEAINYTPPTGVIFLVDISGSMTGSIGDDDGRTKYEWAKAGLASALTALTERDYVGIIAFESAVHQVLSLTPMPQISKIESAIRDMPTPMGGTYYVDALRNACLQLQANKVVEKRHIVMVSDGLISEQERAKFEQVAYENYRDFGITISMVFIGCNINNTNTSFKQSLINGDVTIEVGEELTASNGGGSDYDRMLRVMWLGNDTEAVADSEVKTKEKRQEVADRLHVCNDPTEIPSVLRNELLSPVIKEVELKSYNPQISNLMSSLLNGVRDEDDTTAADEFPLEFSGFYGTRAKADAQVILKGEYDVPIYAQWSFGKGSVGSLMVDLYGEFSSEFISDAKGKRFIVNIVENLMALEDLGQSQIKAELIEDNYINKIQLATNTLSEGEKITGTISWNDNGETKTISLNEVAQTPDPLIYVSVPLSESNHYDRSTFIIKRPGTYTITLQKVDKDGNEVASCEIYKSFSYSKEYDEVNEKSDEELVKSMQYIAEGGNGVYIDDLKDVDKVFETFITDIYKKYDPRTLFCILIIIMFLLDIAVRKFKFKWLHEIIRDIKNSKTK